MSRRLVVTLPEELLEMLRSYAAARKYASVSELVRELIRRELLKHGEERLQEGEGEGGRVRH